MRVGYIRVSSMHQNEARQVEEFKKYNIEKTYIDKASAKDTNRPKLQEMFEFVRENDEVYVLSFDRLARSTKDLLDISERLKEKGVKLVSIKEKLDTSTPAGKLQLTMLGAIAEFERALILERQREGIEIAKREGKFKGGKKIMVNEERFKRLWAYYTARGINKKELAEKLGVSRPTLDRILKEKGLK